MVASWLILAALSGPLADVTTDRRPLELPRSDEVLWPEAVGYVHRTKGALVMSRDIRRPDENG